MYMNFSNTSERMDLTPSQNTLRSGAPSREGGEGRLRLDSGVNAVHERPTPVAKALIVATDCSLI